MTLTDIERLGAFDEAERTFQMDEDAFRTFYELTARSVWVYLAHTSGDSRLADDLLQETYYRYLRARVTFASDEHRRHYLFRIASNLVRDQWRRSGVEAHSDVRGVEAMAGDVRVAERATARIDLRRAMKRLKPRDRSLLWLAYAQGWSHEEIAASLGLRTASLKSMLHRARRRLVALLSHSHRNGGRS